LRAERKSTATLKSYGDGVRAYPSWAAEYGHPAMLDRPTMNACVAYLLDTGALASRSRELAVRRF
jgi:integrase/recombinase XerD